jgi:hypothetical protein
MTLWQYLNGKECPTGGRDGDSNEVLPSSPKKGARWVRRVDVLQADDFATSFGAIDDLPELELRQRPTQWQRYRERIRWRSKL